MRNRRSLAVGLTGILALIVSLQSPAFPQAAGVGGAPAPDINPPVTNCNPKTDTFVDTSGEFKPTPITDELLTSGQPCQQRVNTKGLFGDDALANLQRGFDFYSWLTFIAMNSPADGTSIKSGKRDARTKWESLDNYRPLADVMLKDGKQPTWGTREVPEPCKQFRDTGQIIFQLGEEAFNQPFKTGPLIDQDGNFALFDILMNKPMFDYILTKKLFSQQGQEQFTEETVFPIGNNPGTGANPEPGRMGAIMLKVSYRILDREKNKDLIDQFHTRDALIYFPGGKDATGTGTKAGPACVEKTIGLIGFHVGHKTRFASQWVWTSFEHVSNVPDAEDVGTSNIRGPYSFFNPDCKDCPVNEITAETMGSSAFAAISDLVPQPGRQGQHASTGSAQGSRRFQQVVPRAAQRHRVGKLHAARHAMAERHLQQDRSERRAGPDLSCEFHAGDLQPGQGPARIVELHGLPRQRRELPVQPLRQDRGRQGLQSIGLHVHPGEGAANAMTLRAALSTPT